jgi:broad specificity phosphatase PhoE
MQHIYLIRHGQASFGAENYDKLSDLGKRQAGVIGEYFARQEIVIDRIIHGQMSRQQETAEIIARNAGFNKNLILHKGANEFDSENLIKYYLPKLANQSKKLNDIIHSDENWWASGDNFELFFRALVNMWQADQNCPFEPWDDFKKRCLNCLTDIAQMKEPSTKKHGATLLATSGGLISVIIQSILASENETFNYRAFMDMNLSINNTSISEVVWQKNQSIGNETMLKNRNRLMCFNNITPLLLAKTPELITRK